MSDDELLNAWAQVNVNPFGAMNNDPINFSDPNGNCALAIGAGAGAFAGAGEALGLGAMAGAGAAGVAGVAGVAAIGYAGKAFLNGLPAQTTFYNPQVNYQNAPPSSLTFASSLPPGYWAGDKGAAEWGRKSGEGAKEGKRRFHDIKKGDNMSQPPDKYGVNPNTGDVIDPEGNSVGNLNDTGCGS